MVCPVWPAVWGSAPRCWRSICSPDSGCSHQHRRRSRYTEITQQITTQCLQSCGSHWVLLFHPEETEMKSVYCSAVDIPVIQETDIYMNFCSLFFFFFLKHILFVFPNIWRVSLLNKQSTICENLYSFIKDRVHQEITLKVKKNKKTSCSIKSVQKFLPHLIKKKTF